MGRARWLSLVVGLALGCGARTELEIGELGPGDAGRRVDSGTPPVTSCEPIWDACRIDVPPMLVSRDDLGQSPDVVWADDRLLVVYDSDAGNTLVAYTLGGDELARDPVGGIQAPRIAWNEGTHTGLVVMDTFVRWLGARGLPVEPAFRPDVGYQMYGDPAAVDGGFVILTGVNAFSSPPRVDGARVPPEPVSTLRFEPLTEPGPYSPPEHAIDDRGLGLFSVSLLWDGGFGAIYGLDGAAPPTVERDLSVPGAFRPLGVVQRAADRWLFYGSVSPTFAHYLTNLDTGHTRLVAENTSGSDGHLERLGDDAIAAFRFAPSLGERERVVLTKLDLEATPMMIGRFDLSEPGRVGHSARIAPTPRGLAVVWSEATGDHEGGMSARLAVLECCP